MSGVKSMSMDTPATIKPAAIEAAKKPSVLFLHGLTGAPGDLQIITKHLKRVGYHVEAPMLPGHGLDEKGLLKTGWRDWLAAAEHKLMAMTADGSQAFVGGLSMGAVLSLALAAKHPDRVKGVVCYAVTLRYDGWIIPKNAWMIPIGARIPVVNRYRFKERPPYGIKDDRLRAKMEEMLFSGAIGEAGLPFMPGKSLAQNLSLIRYTRKLFTKITAPLLIVHAHEDDITSIRNAEALSQMVKGPVRKLYLDDSYHLVTVDRERAKVAKATEAFLEELIETGALAEAKASASPSSPPAPPARSPKSAIERAQARARYHAVAEEGITATDICETLAEEVGVSAVSVPQDEAAGHVGLMGMFVALGMPASSAWTRKTLGWEADRAWPDSDLKRMGYGLRYRVDAPLSMEPKGALRRG